MLEATTFHRPNIYKVNFSGVRYLKIWPESVFLMHDVFLPNGSRVKDVNLIDNGHADCNISLDANWIVSHGKVITQGSGINTSDCYFGLQSYDSGATMVQYYHLANTWDSCSWPYLKVILKAHMSDHVTIELAALNNDGQILAERILGNC